MKRAIQGSTVEKYFRNPYLFAIDPKLVVKEALTLQELPDHGLPRGQIAILTGKHAVSTSSLQAVTLIKRTE